MSEINLITLCSYDWKAVICPTFGMNTIQLTHFDREILNTPVIINHDTLSNICFGNQLLFPPNRTAGAKFSFENEEYTLQLNEPKYHNHIHGNIKNAFFSVIFLSRTELVSELINNGQLFPFPFKLTVSCSIKEDGYHQSFTFDNIGYKEMPLTFGLHTNFIAPKSFSVPINKKWQRDDCYIPTGEFEELSDQEKSYRSGFSSIGIPISGCYTSSNNNARLDDIKYTVSKNFDQWILYNGGGSRHFLSIEPQCAPVNALNSGVGLLRLRPKQTETFSISIQN